MHSTAAKQYVSSSASRPTHFIEADDGFIYRIKPLTEAQALAGKVFGPRLVGHIGIPSINTAIVHLDDGFVRRAQAACASEAVRASLKAGVYFGSALPADPRITPIYDLLTPSTLPKVSNIRDFSVMRTLDLWIGNVTTGHAVFVRSPNKSFLAHMIGFGDCFSWANPPNTTTHFPDFLIGDYLDWNASEDAVSLIEEIDVDTLDFLTADIPIAWWQGHQKTREDTIRYLCGRQTHLAEMLRARRQLVSAERLRKPPQADGQTVQAFKRSSA
jgi:hypothetical protein